MTVNCLPITLETAHETFTPKEMRSKLVQNSLKCWSKWIENWDSSDRINWVVATSERYGIFVDLNSVGIHQLHHHGVLRFRLPIMQFSSMQKISFITTGRDTVAMYHYLPTWTVTLCKKFYDSLNHPIGTIIEPDCTIHMRFRHNYCWWHSVCSTVTCHWLVIISPSKHSVNGEPV